MTEAQLIKSIAANVSASVRPFTPIPIYVDFDISKTMQLTTNGVLTVIAMLSVYWNDPRVAWDTSTYNFNTTNVPRSALWIPSLSLVNSASGNDIVIPSTTTLALVSSDGTVQLIFTTQYTVYCTLHLKNFPFDSQTCALIFSSFDINSDFPNVVFSNESTVTAETYSQTGEFSLSKYWINVSRSEYDGDGAGEWQVNAFRFAAMNISLAYTRQASYYVTTIIIPAFVVTLLSAFAILIPSENPVKVTMACTLMMSLYTLQQSAARVLPATQETSSLALGSTCTLIIAAIALMIVVVSVSVKMLGPAFFSNFCSKSPAPKASQNEIIQLKAYALNGMNNYQDQDDLPDVGLNTAELILKQSKNLQEKLLALSESQSASNKSATEKQKETAKVNTRWRNRDLIANISFFIAYIVVALVCLMIYDL